MSGRQLGNAPRRARYTRTRRSRDVFDNTSAPAGLDDRAGDLFSGVPKSEIMLGRFLVKLMDGDKDTRAEVAIMLAGKPRLKPKAPPPPPPPPVDPSREELRLEILAYLGFDADCNPLTDVTNPVETGTRGVPPSDTTGISGHAA